ncbi:MAG TPA: 30S ribosomal protein S16 [Verrucomicrobiales bacterium]|nr:30S ribosomal protein S16 [Verrucomicrobiales bacterium]
MSVKLRLKRIGARNTPIYRIVATDSRTKRDGRPIEELGTYNPVLQTEPNFDLNLERAEHWLSVGAQPSDTVRSFIRKARRAAAGLPPKESKPKKVAQPEPAEEPKAEEPLAEAAEATAAPAAEEAAEAPAEETATEEPTAEAEEAPVEEPAPEEAEESAAEEGEGEEKADA